MTEAPSAEERALDALTKILESAVSEEMVDAQKLVLRRLATSGDLFPSRIPPPLNITQIGGYLNLIEDDPVLSAQVLASALGVAGPNPTPGFDPTLPPLYFSTRGNDRPIGAAQAATPVTFRVRNDFAAGLDAALATLHDLGVQLPVLAADGLLPPLSDARAAGRPAALPGAPAERRTVGRAHRPGHGPAGRRTARRCGRHAGAGPPGRPGRPAGGDRRHRGVRPVDLRLDDLHPGHRQR